ncbi:MAG: N-acetylmuramoyl-L-alanine amidase, partial [Thermanaeromonas sp.]|uniref:N-acetylmuramoyl-L-alanine amidase n=1 Tax=Thermanaeromonas sp. TaxID=2003697 RepID=UPI00243E97D4
MKAFEWDIDANNHDVAASESLGNALIRGVVEFSSIPNLSDAKCKNYIVLEYTKMPASLIECGFMTNSDDLWALQNEDDDIGYGIGLEANF